MIASDTKHCMLRALNPTFVKAVGRHSVVWMRSTDICVRKVEPSVGRQSRLYSKLRPRPKPKLPCKFRARSRWPR